MYAQFSPAYVSSHGNPNYPAPEKIGYSKDPSLKKIELLVGLGYYKDVERDPTAAELPLPPRGAATPLGTPSNTAQILRNAVPRSDPSTTVFAPAKNVDWMVNPNNTGGFENFKTPFDAPIHEGGDVLYYIRQTMVNVVVELNYPDEVSTKFSKPTCQLWPKRILRLQSQPRDNCGNGLAK